PAPLGDERRLERPHAAREPHDLGMLRQLEVQDRADGRPQGAHVGVLDVTAVLTQVAGDAVGAAALGGFGRPHRVGLVGAARLAQRRHVINVDVEAHAFLPSEHSALPGNLSVRPRLVVLVALASLACGGGSTQTPAPQSLTETLAQFLSAVKANDLDQMGALWGNERGPAKDRRKAEGLRTALYGIQKYWNP